MVGVVVWWWINGVCERWGVCIDARVDNFEYVERERGDLLRTKYDSKKYERESVCKIFGERFKISLGDLRVPWFL